MHIPDGFLSAPVWAALDVLSVPAVAIMARRAQNDLGDRRIPLLGVMGAFVFAAQMINFPIPLGTSGHLVGGALLTIVLGPPAAALVMTAILVIQAFVFQDGGVMALGANVFNMAIGGVLAGYVPYRLWASQWRSAAIFASGVLSVLVSACLALSELGLSGVPLRGRGHLLAISLVLFFVSALIEGAITLSAVRALERLNPTWVRGHSTAGSRVAGAVAMGSVLLVTIGILIASAAPDGIMKLSVELGVPLRAWAHAPLAGYEWSGFESSWVRRAMAGLSGLVLIYGACVLTGRWILKPRPRSA